MQVGPYQLAAPLPAGGDFARYKAVDVRTQAAAEVRLLRQGFRESLEFEATARHLAMAELVDSPSVRAIKAMELEVEPSHVVLEWLEGLCLSDQHQGDNELGPVEVLELGCQLGEALVAIHRIGFVHGSIDPAMIQQRTKRQWVLDVADRGEERGFIAAEALRGEAEPASDIFSVAAILYWLLLDKRLAEAEVSELSIELIGQELASIDQLQSATELLGTLLVESLSSDPSARPHAADFTARLRGCERQVAGESAVTLPAVDNTLVMEQTAPPQAAIDRTMVGDLQPIVLEVETTPERLGRFRIVKKLGEGGMGTVYQGEDMADGALVAIKVLGTSVAQDDQSRRRFAKEARMLARIKSPYVANLLEFNDDGGTDYLVIEFVAGSDLAALLEQEKALDESAALALMVDVARGLSLAHSRGIIHRDIKPDNVLLTSEGMQRIKDGDAAPDSQQPLAKLTDFGLARGLDQTESLAITRQGTVMGTPYYMPPEQCRGEATDARSDVYSMGATLFHLLAGRPPYVAKTHVGVLNKHANDPVPSLSKYKPGIASGIERVVEKTLAKNPDARYADADALLVDLENLLHGEPTSLAIHPALPDRDSANTLEYEFTWTLSASAAQLWPFVANTDRLNQAMGLPPARFTTRNDPERGVRRFAETKIVGQKIAWEEHPFEWIEGRRMSVLRQFSHGPFAWFVNVVELTPQTDGRTLLSHKVLLEPKNVFGRFIAKMEIGIKAKRSLTRIYQQIDGYITGGKQSDATADPFHKSLGLNSRRRSLLNQRLGRLRNGGVDAAVIDAIGQFLEYASDQDVARIRPRAFAERFGVNSDDVLAACLHAAREGLLVLLWDILCPSCQIPANVEESLAALEGHGHCEACNVDFDLDFANSIEMIFRAHPEIRDVEVRTYCIGGPAFSAHVVAQVRLAVGERFEMELGLGEGSYRIRGPQLPFAVDVRVSAASTNGRCDVPLSKPLPRELVPILKPGSQVITLLNDGPTELLVRLERTASTHDAVTAAEASSNPLFRELLPGEVLSPGQIVSVATVTVLMVQLDEAAKLYGELGDGAAFDVIRESLVALDRCATQNQGAVVKIIGEGMIATFTDPESAVRSVLDMQSAISEVVIDRPLTMRAALHRGPAMVTTLNDRLDYFGSTIHIAHRLLDLAAAGDIMLTDAIADNPDVASLLTDASATATVVSTDLANVVVQRYQHTTRA